MRGRGRPNRQPRGGRGSNPSSRPTDSPHNNNNNNNTNNTPSSGPRTGYHSVPPFRAIRVGGAVSIVLKEDQPTGHQVKGIVADLLTRGDHPRGVKVRLRDGRVGRVQGLVADAEGERGEALVGGAGANLGRNGEGGGGRGGQMRGGRIEKDVRDEDEYLYDENRVLSSNDGWFAALEAADQRHREGSRAEGKVGGTELSITGVATCPVCGAFEGDEIAVAHHVQRHFEE